MFRNNDKLLNIIIIALNYIPKAHSPIAEQFAGGGEHNGGGRAAASLLAGGCGNHTEVAC
jgi:hypothetical protein